MKNNLKRLLSLILVATLCIPAMPITANAETVLPETPAVGNPTNAVLNYRDVEEFNTSFAGETSSEIENLKDTLPASYSSSSNIPSSISVSKKGDYVTSVKDQNPYGTCWAHAAISVAESSYIKANSLKASTAGIDWNEYHLVYYFWNTPEDPLGLFGGDYVVNYTGKNDLDAGGNSIFTLHAYANWIGASADKSYDADDVLAGKGEGDTNFAFKAAAHMENGYLLTMPDMTTSTYQADMNVVKQMIMEYGSVAMSYYAYHGGQYWSGNAYQYIDVNPGTNHAVTIVGWNDNISASNFGITPPGDGAWLVKNSWGTSWGQGGYFWLSYYDESIGANAFAFDFTDADTYDNNYQYDGGVYAMGGFYDYDTITGANAFVADSEETIEAVGFYTANVNVNYTIQIYTDLGANDLPGDGTLALTKSGTETYAGFHTVDLGKSIQVDKGERYAVVLTIEKDGYQVYMMTDATGDYDWLQTYSFAKEGESYLGTDISSLEDVNEGNASYADGYSLRIKSFTNEAGGIIKKASDGNWYYYKGGKIDYTYFGIAPNANGNYYYVKNGKVNFKINGIVKCGSKSTDWYYFKSGKVQDVETIVKKESNGAYYYVKDGQVQFSYTGIAKKTSNNKWYYVNKGKVDNTYDGVAPNKSGSLYYVENGVVDFSKSGILKRSGAWYYFKKGKVQDVETIVKKDSNGAYYYVKDGKVQSDYTGIAKKTSNNKWYYVKNGKVDSTFDGVASKNGKGLYYVENGVVDFSKSGIFKRGNVWYYFKSGKVQDVETMVKKESNGCYYYVKGGIVQTSFTGVAEKPSNGKWYYIVKGKLDFTFGGIASDRDGNQYYVVDGVVDFTYSGTVEYNGYTYTIEEGRVVSVE